MKVKLDENLPTRLVDVLERRGHEVDTVATEGLAGKPDVHVWASACREGHFFITQDLDFSDIRQFQPARTRVCCWCACASRVRMLCWSASAWRFRCMRWSPGPAVSSLLTDHKLRIKRL